MSDHISPTEAVNFYQTLTQLLQGGDVVLFIPQGSKVAVVIADKEQVKPPRYYDDFQIVDNLAVGLSQIADR